VRDRSGRFRNFVSIRQDVTGRKGAEQRVREQAALLDQAAEAIVVADLNHRVSFWNRGAERLFGFTAVEALGHQLQEVLPLESTIGSADFLHAITLPSDWRGEIRTHDRAGEPLVIETSITMLIGDDGRPTGRLYFSADITTKKGLEEQFLRVQRMENIGMLAAGVAHDLNNILAPMRMVGPLLRDRLSEPRDLKLLDTLESCAVRGAALVRQILGFAQGVSGEPRTVQVKHLLRDIVDVITATFPKSIVLEEDVPSNLWPINGNPTQVHQILLNLCVNARDAMPEGGTLRLSARNRELDDAAVQGIEGAQPGPWIVIEVQDTGTGITPEVLAHMWEPLFTTKGTDKGTGLGLSTVRGIVVQHRGFVTIESEVGHGSTFRVHLPAENTTGETADPDTPAVQARAKGELVMFVDDEPSVRDVAQTALTRQGYRVITAGDGAEAIAQFAPHASEIALVITDIDMPNFDGVALCRVIHTLSPKTKLLVISGLSTGAPSDPPGVGFLAKPFDLDTLLQRTDAVLRGTDTDAAGVDRRETGTT
jgi:PAS domain S-box-containing protein